MEMHELQSLGTCMVARVGLSNNIINPHSREGIPAAYMVTRRAAEACACAGCLISGISTELRTIAIL